MDDRTTTHSAHPTPSEPSEVGVPRHPAALQALAAGIGILAGIVVGAGSGLLAATVTANDCGPSDEWCGLGALVAGVFIGLLCGAIAYVSAGVATIFRCRPQGRRAVHIAVHFVLPAAGVAALTLLGFAVNLLS